MKTLYICATDWDWEVGEAIDLEGKMPLYSDLEHLKKERKCWESCGVLEIQLTVIKQINHSKPWG
jgi:hypothetical protein